MKHTHKPAKTNGVSFPLTHNHIWFLFVAVSGGFLNMGARQSVCLCVRLRTWISRHGSKAICVSSCPTAHVFPTKNLSKTSHAPSLSTLTFHARVPRSRSTLAFHAHVPRSRSTLTFHAHVPRSPSTPTVHVYK